MDSSDEGMTSQGSSPMPPSLEELSARGLRALMLPWIIGVATTLPPSQAPTEVLVLVNYRTGSVTLIGGATGRDIDSLLASKDGQFPASKASIEAMPGVKVEEGGFECAICLTEFGVNEEAREMPCKHMYHKDCIEKWLRIRGSCPICRYKMPVEEEAEKTKGSGGDEEVHGEEGGEGAFAFHFLFSGMGGSGQDSGTGMGESGDGNANYG